MRRSSPAVRQPDGGEARQSSGGEVHELPEASGELEQRRKATRASRRPGGVRLRRLRRAPRCVATFVFFLFYIFFMQKISSIFLILDAKFFFLHFCSIFLF